MPNKRLNLDNVTLFCVDCKYYEQSIIAMKKSCEDIDFAKMMYFSDKVPKNLDDSIVYVPIAPLNNLIEYSYFMLAELPKYIDTEFCLSVHQDGWVINPHNWKDEFLEYDYIGAPWEYSARGEEYRVGNGGVSIRSKKLMDLLVNRGVSRSCGHEDTYITHTHRPFLESNGVKFAPLELAKYFAMERKCADIDLTFDDLFAFHGRVHTEEHIEKMKEMEKEYNEIF